MKNLFLSFSFIFVLSLSTTHARPVSLLPLANTLYAAPNTFLLAKGVMCNENYTNGNIYSHEQNLALYEQPIDSPCAIPKGRLTNLVFTTTQSTVSGSFTDTTNADGYLAVFSVNIRLDFSPVDGMTYLENSIVGNATVLKYGGNATLNKSGLTPNTYYYITIFPYKNASCVGGPRYNSSPTVSMFSTKP